MMKKKTISPSEQLAGFLNFVDQCTAEYRLACDTVSEEDKRLQDLLHGIEFSDTRSEADKELRKSFAGAGRCAESIKTL
ncbi:MAG: hypothetical protein E7251_03800 [Paenibacillaceae bacterium]|nr:hypothetical protein [Paenibacillaceae bacterium]